MKRRLFSFLIALLITFTCIVPAVAYTPQVRDFNINDCTGISIGPIMSYNEMLNYMVQTKHIPYSEALRSLPATTRAGRNSYRTLSVTLTVEQQPSYQPTLDFYCEVSVGDGVWGIVSIFNVQMNRYSNGMSKQFSGDIEVWLRGPERIQYIVNGDFYNNGTTSSSSSGGIDINIGGYGKISYVASSTTTTNWFAYCYNSDIKRFT